MRNTGRAQVDKHPEELTEDHKKKPRGSEIHSKLDAITH
jgi:hypothetical protein